MSKNIILFVNAIRPATFEALKKYENDSGHSLIPMIIVDSKIQNAITERNGQKDNPDIQVLSADFDSALSLRKTLQPYMQNVLAVTSQYENSILELKKLVPYFPYLTMPTEASLDWSTEKKLMRQMLEGYDASLVPGYLEVTNETAETIESIEKNLDYPMIVKPSGLEGSLLVTLVKNRDELQRTLGYTLHEIQHAYDVWIKRQKPTILVEEFMDGDMYSVDTYISSQGKCYHTPPVKVITGKKVGFDDFFGYMQTTPSGLSPDDIVKAHEATAKACHAVGLRSITAHVELMRLHDRWKIIELGPRIGGYRHDIYKHSYGINHIANDIINRSDQEPVIPNKVLRHTAAFNIYATSEGIVKSLEGADHVRALPSFVSIVQDLYPGDRALFAKNNGDPVAKVMLSHEDSQQFQNDVNVMKDVLKVEVISEDI